jgi:cyclic pyranopterin monophosphate synthase
MSKNSAGRAGGAGRAGKAGKAGATAATPSRGQGNPRRGVSVSSRREWGPAAIGKNVLSHVDARGRIKMVDVGEKPITDREAIARGSIAMSAEARRLIRAGAVKKGDPLQTARLAGIMAAKQTAALIPLCHPLSLSKVDVELTATARGYTIESRVRARGQTGVEMEALTAVAVAALTIYDMVKAVDRAMVIGDIRVELKSGGRSGTYRRAKMQPRRHEDTKKT